MSSEVCQSIASILRVPGRAAVAACYVPRLTSQPGRAPSRTPRRAARRGRSGGAFHGLHEAVVGRDPLGHLRVDLGERAHRLVRQPHHAAADRLAEPRHEVGEPSPLVGVEVQQHGAVEDDQRAVRGRGGRDIRHSLEEIAAHDLGRIGRRDRRGRAQPRDPAVVVGPRPDEVREPVDGVGVGGVDGVEVDPAPPHHLGVAGGDRMPRRRPRRQDDIARPVGRVDAPDARRRRRSRRCSDPGRGRDPRPRRPRAERSGRRCARAAAATSRSGSPRSSARCATRRWRPRASQLSSSHGRISRYVTSGQPSHLAAAKTRLGCCFAVGSAARRPTTSGSAAIPSAQSS